MISNNWRLQTLILKQYQYVLQNWGKDLISVSEKHIGNKYLVLPKHGGFHLMTHDEHTQFLLILY